MHIGTIHFYNRSFPPEIRLEKESRALIKAGHRVTVLTQRIRDDEAEYERYEEGFEIVRARIMRPGLPAWILSRFTFLNKEYRVALHRFIREQRPDILHVHEFNQVPTVLSIAREHKIPVVADLHENMPAALQAFRSKYPLIKKIPHAILYNYHLWRHYQTLCLSKCAGILTVVPEATDILVSLGIPCEKIIDICNSEDETTFKMDPEQADKEIVNKYKNLWMVSYVGGVSAERGLDTTIKALPFVRKKIPNFRLVVVGAQGDQSRQLLSWASMSDVKDMVEVIDWQPFNKVNSYVMASCVCLVPHNAFEHTHTTVPHKLFQYMICSKPVLASDCRSLKRIIDDTGAGLVFKADCERDLADKLVFMYENPELLKEMGESGRNAALGKYAWRNEAKKLVEFYSALSMKS